MSIASAVPVGQPLPGASFWQAVQRFFQGYVRFEGRASRSEFWWSMLGTSLISLVVQIPFWIAWVGFMARAVAAEAGSPSGFTPADLLASLGAMLGWMGLLLLASLALLLPSLAVMWRRLQDAGFPGALALLGIVGLGIVPLVMCCFPSSPAGLRYDPAYRAQLAAGMPRGAYEQAQYGQPQYAQPQYGQAPYAQAPYGEPHYGQPQYEQAPYGEPYHGQPQYGQAPYGEPQPPFAEPDRDRA